MRYGDDIEKLSRRASLEVPSNWVISLPVPLSGGLHAFFACRPAQKGGVTVQPGACFAIRESDDAVLVFDHKAVFSGLRRPRPTVPLRAIPRAGWEGRSLDLQYRDAARDVFAGRLSRSTRLYADAVLNLAPVEHAELYRALAPEFFGHVESRS